MAKLYLCQYEPVTLISLKSATGGPQVDHLLLTVAHNRWIATGQPLMAHQWPISYKCAAFCHWWATSVMLSGYLTRCFSSVLQRNLGVIQENPSSTDGVIKILQHLSKYIPKTGTEFLPTVIYGDGLSCERHNDAQLARANEATPQERLENLEPASQEFHKRMLRLQVNSYKLLTQPNRLNH